MARPALPYHGSLLDRLVENPSDRGSGPSLVQLREGLRRDLEALLNARRRFIGWRPELEELSHSLLAYGLQDFTHEMIGSADFRREFAEQVTWLLRRLEPRIQVHEVQIIDNTDFLDRRLRFRIAGSVRFGEERHGLSFDSYLDPIECDITVRDQ